MHALPRHCTVVGRKHEHVCAAWTARDDHAFAHAELHFARCEIRDANDQPPNEFSGS